MRYTSFEISVSSQSFVVPMLRPLRLDRIRPAVHRHPVAIAILLDLDDAHPIFITGRMIPKFHYALYALYALYAPTFPARNRRLPGRPGRCRRRCAPRPAAC